MLEENLTPHQVDPELLLNLQTMLDTFEHKFNDVSFNTLGKFIKI